MTNRLDLSERHRRKIETLLHEYLPDVEVWAYGSRVSGRSHDGSDLDLVLRGPGLKEVPTRQLADFVEAVRESSIPFLVEARDWARLPERFRREIEREYVVINIATNPAIDGPKCPQQQGWKKLNLGQVCTKIGSGATPRGGRDAYLPSGPYALIRSQNVFNNGFRDEGLAYIGHQAASKLKNVEVAKDDILLNITGDSVARACQVRCDILPARVNQHVAIIRPDPARLDPGFLRYALVVPKMQAQLLSWAGSGGTRNALTKGMIESLDITAPSNVHEQKAIAQILGALDDKIALNQRMNETLEAMARVIFRDWFVDFGPVRAKAEGREPYLSSELWDLFPDVFGDNDLPKGWNNGILADIAESPKRSVSPMDVRQETPYIGLAHMPRHSISLGVWDCAGTVTSNKSIFKKGEILFGKLRPYFHKVGRAPVDGICSTDIVVVNPKGANWDAFTLQYLSSDEFVNYTSQVASGTKMPRTSWKLMGQYQITHPTEQIASAFQTLLSPMINRIENNSLGTQHLATIRDVLLPRLVSGEIRVCEAEKLAEAIVS